MDCLLGNFSKCSSSPTRKSRSLKKQWSSKKYTYESTEEQCREWPVDASQYELLEYAGKGAHAVVYKGRCKAFDEVVAIKCLDLDCNWDLTALVREATIMKEFNHPAVLPLYAAFVAGRELWFVTPYMGAGSVRSIMKQQFPLGLDEVVIATIMHPVLLALEYVHKNNGIHRDVKADNILVSEDGEVVLADFGVAAARMREVSMVNLDMQAVMATTFVGTPCWMAPEVMEQTLDGYHTSADTWSFGITLIELAHGRPPLARMHPMRVLMDTMHKPPPQLDDHPNGTQFSKAFKELVDDCLHKDPDQRPSAAALLNHKFFRMARDPEFLKEHFLAGLQEQQRQQQQQHACAHQAAAPDSPAGQNPQQQQQHARNLAGVMTAWHPSHGQNVPVQLAGPLAGRKQHQQSGNVLGSSAAAARAGSGPLSAPSLSSGPLRLTSNWFFPPPIATSLRLLTHSEHPSTSEADAAAEAAAVAAAAAAAVAQGRQPPAAGCSPTGTARLPPFVYSPTGTTRLASAAVSGQGSTSGTVSSSGSSALHSAAATVRSSSLEQQLQPFILQQAAKRAGSGRLEQSSVLGNVQLRTCSSGDQYGLPYPLLQQAAGRAGLGLVNNTHLGKGNPTTEVSKGLGSLRAAFSSSLPTALLEAHSEVEGVEEDGRDVAAVGGEACGTQASARSGSSSSTQAATAPVLPGTIVEVAEASTQPASADACAAAEGQPAAAALKASGTALGPPCADVPLGGGVSGAIRSVAGPDADAVVRVIRAGSPSGQQPAAVSTDSSIFPTPYKQQPQQEPQQQPQQELQHG